MKTKTKQTLKKFSTHAALFSITVFIFGAFMFSVADNVYPLFAKILQITYIVGLSMAAGFSLLAMILDRS